VDNGIVLTKGGGLMAAWAYHGPDLDSSTQEELGAMSARVNAALKLGDGWVLHCDAVRAPRRATPRPELSPTAPRG
jgi:Type IV secretory pathway, VirB4 components